MRRKIWDHQDFQCAIIGTCLSLRELRKISRQTGLQLDQSITEFQVHAIIVGMCKDNCPVAKAVNKLLDKKYAGSLRRFATSLDESALRTLWRKAADEGDIPGPFWAIMSHPNAGMELLSDIFGEVHMLSHLVGSANRADIRRLAEMENRSAEMEAKHTQIKTAFKNRIRELTPENRKLKSKVVAMAKELEAYRNNAKILGTMALQSENESLHRALSVQSLQLVEYDSNNRSLQRQLNAFTKRIDILESDMRDKDLEIHVLEQEMQRLVATFEAPPCPMKCDKAGTPECPGPDLCGKRILYVGGRMNLVRHYRELIKRHGGEFLHHDGGVEETNSNLPKLLSSVDAVLCPVDCVSHNACLAVKNACRTCQRNVKFLRSSGLSSLMRSLHDLAEGSSPDPVDYQ